MTIITPVCAPALVRPCACVRPVLLSLALIAFALPARLGSAEEPPLKVELRDHLGRPTVFLNGKPSGLPSYSAVRRNDVFPKTVPKFFQHPMAVYMVEIPVTAMSADFFGTPWWIGDQVSQKPLAGGAETLDEQVHSVTEGAPSAGIILRMWNHEPISWRKLHPDQLVVTEDGKTLETPSLASDLFWDDCARVSAATIGYCESRPWSKRIVGYANFMRVEGTHEPLVQQWLYDHGPAMTARWRSFLRAKYKTVEALRAAHGDAKLTFETVPVPRDKLRGPFPEVAALLYWQDAKVNQPLRDYLLLMSDLFKGGFKKIADASRKAAGPNRLLLYDALKQPMQGWSNWGFFDANFSWPIIYPDTNAGSGSMDVSSLFKLSGFDGLITPHDYQARGLGGIFEPEAPADTMVLRGKAYLCEMDTRSYTGHDPLGRAANDKEFAAITWRNLATSLTRGFNFYWMDLFEDWFGSDGMHAIIQRQCEVLNESAQWPHETPPGIAVVLDDAAVLETNGSGAYFNEAIMWQLKMGLARCGVPYRIYLLEDLALPNFPKHRVFYFPNLFKVDDARLSLLRKTVFRDGNVVVWGPGSGISDGTKIGRESAQRLTGFDFELFPVNYQRRLLIGALDGSSHAITRHMSNDTVIGSPLSYGPLLYPKDGTMLGQAWAKYGRVISGLSVKTFGKGARGALPDKQSKGTVFGSGDWASVFTTAVPLPADLWRGLARYAGAHVYSDDGDVLLASEQIVAIHAVRSGKRTIRLPAPSEIDDLTSGKHIADRSDTITVEIDGPETRVFHVQKH